MEIFIETRSRYERLSNYDNAKEKYIPKRPNSCEKPRNKKLQLAIPSSFYSTVSLLNFNKIIKPNQISQKIIYRPHSSYCIHKLKRYGSPKLKQITNPLILVVPQSKNRNDVYKKIIKRPKVCDPKICDTNLIRVLKKSIQKSKN